MSELGLRDSSAYTCIIYSIHNANGVCHTDGGFLSLSVLSPLCAGGH